MGLSQEYLLPVLTLLYGFTRDSLIPWGKISLPITIYEYPRVSTVVAEFLVVDCTSMYNAIIRKPIVKALKAITSIYHLTMKLPTLEGTGCMRGSQFDSREYYN